MEADFLTKDGRRIPFFLTGLKLTIDGVDYLAGTGIDITEKRRAEEVVARERAQLEALFDATEDIIYVADPQAHTLVFVNRVFQRFWGPDAVGKKCHKVLQDRETPCPFCTNDRIFGEHLGEAYTWEFQNETTKRWFRCVDRAIQWPDGRWLRLEIAGDITDAKRLTLEQLRLEKFSALGRVAAGVAHELNNPLMGILNYSQFCIEETAAEDDRLQVLKDIEQEATRCIAIVQNLLGASRLDTEEFGGVSDFSPAEVLNRVERLMAYRTSKEGIQVRIDTQGSLPRAAMSGEAFQQVCINLFSNALDAVEASANKAVVIGLGAKGQDLVLAVSDTGCGIPIELREKVFDLFFTTKPPGKGTGLGLATCWKIVQAAGGRITCESRPGIGTTMTVTLPTRPRSGDQQHG